jgi:hypothetical protein
MVSLRPLLAVRGRQPALGHPLLALLHGLIGLDLLRWGETVPLLLVHVAGDIYGSRTKREGAGADRNDEEERHV